MELCCFDRPKNITKAEMLKCVMEHVNSATKYYNDAAKILSEYMPMKGEDDSFRRKTIPRDVLKNAETSITLAQEKISAALRDLHNYTLYGYKSNRHPNAAQGNSEYKKARGAYMSIAPKIAGLGNFL